MDVTNTSDLPPSDPTQPPNLAMTPEGQLDAQRGDQKDDVQALFSRALFIRCDTLEVRSPVVILQNEKANW